MYDGSGQPVAAQVTYRNARTTVKQDCLPAKAVPRALLTTRQDEWTRGREGRQDKTSQDGDLTQTCVLSCRFRQAIAAATRTHSSRRGRGNGEPVRDHRRGFSGRLGATGSGASDDGRRSSLALLPLSLFAPRLSSLVSRPSTRSLLLLCRRSRRRRRRRSYRDQVQSRFAAVGLSSCLVVVVVDDDVDVAHSARRQLEQLDPRSDSLSQREPRREERARGGGGGREREKNLPLSLQNTCTTFFASLLTQQVGTRRRRQRRRRV